MAQSSHLVDEAVTNHAIIRIGNGGEVKEHTGVDAELGGALVRVERIHAGAVTNDFTRLNNSMSFDGAVARAEIRF